MILNCDLNNTIHIRMGDYDNNLLKFMYEPFYTSIIKICKFKNFKYNFKINDYTYDEIIENDYFIYVGIYKVYDIDFLLLKNRGVKTIYFQSEPCPILTNDFDEIWDYSKKNIKINLSETKLRYLPLICNKKLKKIYQKDSDNLKLLFIGGAPPRVPDSRPHKWSFLMSSDFLKDKLMSTYDVWNESDYENLISKDYSSIFLNLNREGTTSLPSCRITKLLCHKALIISEPVDKEDMELYEDLVFFCDLNQIEEKFRYLLSLNKFERQQIADNIYEKFSERFSTKKIVNNYLS